ncbi:Uncharacterised protein [Nocardia farcinica]|nr:Uncharacterised protein [Nocardia farcinica]
MSIVRVLVRSRTGSDFPAVYQKTSGEVSIVTEHEHGYKSAHRALARYVLGGPVFQVEHLTWMTIEGLRVVMTCWKEEE